jgi:hypothetical protein
MASVEVHSCPECEKQFSDSSALVDHALTAHTAAPTRAAGVRPVKRPGLLRVLTVGGLVLGAALLALIGVGIAGGFDKDSVPETPNSLAHILAAELKASGEIDEYTAVEPSGDWAVEYELDGQDLDGADGTIRSTGAGRKADFEFETYLDDDLYDSITAAAQRHGFAVEGE